MNEPYSVESRRTVAALYQTEQQAEAAVSDLMAGGIPRSDITVTRNTEAAGADRPIHEHGFWHAIVHMFDAEDDDADVYGEGVRRGGSLVTVHAPDGQLDGAVEILDDHDPLDLENSEREWRAAGWNGGHRSAELKPNAMPGQSGEEVIPVVDESLVVGKREVGRGNVRVRSFVREVPASEQVSLRRENVEVERRAVDRPVTDADDAAFRDRTVSMTEVNEEPVVGKAARVKEEVVVRKQVDDTVETVSDTVRKTEVEVDDDRRGGPSRAAGPGLGRSAST